MTSTIVIEARPSEGIGTPSYTPSSTHNPDRRHHTHTTHIRTQPQSPPPPPNTYTQIGHPWHGQVTPEYPNGAYFRQTITGDGEEVSPFSSIPVSAYYVV